MMLCSLFAVAAALMQEPTGSIRADPLPMMRRMPRAAPPDRVIGDTASLPMTFTNGLPTLEVMINGKGPFKVGFDTGAPGGPHLTTRLADTLALHPVGEAMAVDPSGRNPVAMKLVRLDTVAFGGVVVEGWTGSALPARPGRLETIDAVVGLDAFAGYVVTLDYPHARFELRRGALPAPDGQTRFSYQGKSVPEAPLTVEGRSIPAHIDTGNVREGVIVPAGFAEGLPGKAQARSTGIARTVSNTIEMFSVPVQAPVAIGSATLAATSVGYPSIVPIANVGSLALTRTILRIDPANQRLELTGG